MTPNSKPVSFQQIHVEVARNATDDFNPFHDKNRWQNVTGNPFGGPIVLGFQLECLIAEHMRRYRQEHDENVLIDAEQLRYSNYEFKFAGAVMPGQAISVSVKPSRFSDDENPTLSNRVSLHADGRLSLAGYKRESRFPLYLPEIDLSGLGDLNSASDRSNLGNGSYFLKRKYMTTSNAKNFLSGSLVEQAEYIDEIAERVQFPEIFPCSLLSSALLEKAWHQGHDFEKQPMVYRSHQLCIDRELARSLRSNDGLSILVSQVTTSDEIQRFDCFGIKGSIDVLFRARIELMPLV